jgi:hypothetical protein
MESVSNSLWSPQTYSLTMWHINSPS